MFWMVATFITVTGFSCVGVSVVTLSSSGLEVDDVISVVLGAVSPGEGAAAAVVVTLFGCWFVLATVK